MSMKIKASMFKAGQASAIVLEVGTKVLYFNATITTVSPLQLCEVVSSTTKSMVVRDIECDHTYLLSPEEVDRCIKPVQDTERGISVAMSHIMRVCERAGGESGISKESPDSNPKEFAGIDNGALRHRVVELGLCSVSTAKALHLEQIHRACEKIKDTEVALNINYLKAFRAMAKGVSAKEAFAATINHMDLAMKLIPVEGDGNTASSTAGKSNRCKNALRLRGGKFDPNADLQMWDIIKWKAGKRTQKTRSVICGNYIYGVADKMMRTRWRGWGVITLAGTSCKLSFHESRVQRVNPKNVPQNMIDRFNSANLSFAEYTS
jgi:hypothetical protein